MRSAAPGDCRRTEEDQGMADGSGALSAPKLKQAVGTVRWNDQRRVCGISSEEEDTKECQSKPMRNPTTLPQ